MTMGDTRGGGDATREMVELINRQINFSARAHPARCPAKLVLKIFLPDLASSLPRLISQSIADGVKCASQLFVF